MNSRLNFVTGIFNRGIKNNPLPVFNNFTTSLADVVTRSTTTSRTKAAYGQADYRITDQVVATAGLRYTVDKITQMQEVLNPSTLAVTSTIGGPSTPAGAGRFKSTSYTVGLRYQLDSDTMFYFTHAKGYSAGGLQNVVGQETFEPDNLYNFEVGAKARIRASDDLELRLNTSAYYGVFSGVKVAASGLFPIPGTESGRQYITITSNAGEARVTGASADVTARFRNRFQLQVLGGYMNNYYTRYDSLNPLTGAAVDLSDTPFLNTPKWKYTAIATYWLPVDAEKVGDISIGADFTATPRVWANIAKPFIPNDPNDPNTGAICRLRRTAANGYGLLSADDGWAYKDCAPSNHNLNLRVDWRDPLGNRDLTASLVVLNATGFKGFQGLGGSYDAAGYDEGFPTPPRYAYLELRYKF